jgi:hypothetical protein
MGFARIPAIVGFVWFLHRDELVRSAWILDGDGERAGIGLRVHHDRGFGGFLRISGSSGFSMHRLRPPSWVTARLRRSRHGAIVTHFCVMPTHFCAVLQHRVPDGAWHRARRRRRTPMASHGSGDHEFTRE